MRKWFSYGLLLLAFAAGFCSCAREHDPYEYAGGINIIPRLLQQLQTKAAKDEMDPDIQAGDEVAARDDMRENYFGTLDVFVKKQADAEDAAWFKEYHLTETTPEAGIEQIEHLISNNWAEEGFVPNVLYDIYATANDPQTALGAGVNNLQDLKALRTTKNFIYKYHSDTMLDNGSNFMTMEEDGISKKSFIMDGKIEGWQIDPNSSRQVWDMQLSRAAAKILLLIRFDGDSDNVLIADEDTGDPQLDGEGRAVFGSLKDYLSYNDRSPGLPRAKYVRFNFTTSDIADGAYEPLTEDLRTDGGNFICIKEGLTDGSGNPLSNVDDHYVVVTYCYPFSWNGDSSRIPYILLSVFYSKDTDPSAEQTRSYYRIPVCDESVVTGLERNKIYVADVVLSSMGSSNEAVEAQDEELRIEYHVIPWTETNMTQEATTVRLSDTKYLMVTPTEYTLKGDGTQSIDLQYFASTSIDDGRYVEIDQSTVTITYINKDGNTVDIKGSVNKTPASPDGTQDITYTFTAPASGTANGEAVTIRITPSGFIRVSSQALSSRAIKDIQFDVKLLASGLDAEHIHIRHFPLDNIQSYTGSWSSRWGKGYTQTTVKEYSFNPTRDGWESWDGYDENVECTKTQYNYALEGKSTQVLNDGTPSDHIASDYRVNYTTGTSGSTVQTQYRNYVTDGAVRCTTDGESNAVLGADGYWYWGDTRVSVNSNQDWRGENGGGTGTRYRWTNYHRSQFKKTHYYARGYYRNVTVNVPTTGTWVEWGGQNGTTNEGIFTAKVYYNGMCYAISGPNSRGSSYTNLTNPHMYVLQITSTSDKYALGKPVLDANYQSQDKVCSPAFMIASQLGAVSTTNSATTASTHCGTYMEVEAGTGKRFVGWRLPTKQEIEVIIGYQDGTFTSGITMVTVLGGAYYWALDGTTANVPSGSGGSNTTGYVRCVRDLTLEEVSALNGTY